MITHCKNVIAENRRILVDPVTLWMARSLLDALRARWPRP